MNKSGSGSSLDVLWKAVSLVDSQSCAMSTTPSPQHSTHASAPVSPAPARAPSPMSSIPLSSSPSALHDLYPDSLRRRVLQNETLKVDTSPQADPAPKEKHHEDSPVSPLSLKKLNLADFEQNSENKRRRSSGAKDGSHYVKIHIAREIKHEGGNVVRLQVSRNYVSAADAVGEHFARSLSGEFAPPSLIASTKILSTSPPHGDEHHALSSVSGQEKEAGERRTLSMRSLRASVQQDHVSPASDDAASMGHETEPEAGASS